MLYCVAIDSNHEFPGNLIAEQHRLRHQEVIARQDWSVSEVRDMEFDEFDNPATIYLVWADARHIVRGVSRLYSTARPYMLEKFFSHLVTKRTLPKSELICEGSRFCIDSKLPPLLRKQIASDLVLGGLEYGLANGIKEIVGVMLPAFWKGLFIKKGWPVEPLGPRAKVESGHEVYAGSLKLNQEVLQSFRASTGIYKEVTHFPQSWLTKKEAA